ncbi:MAG: hypothetical protein KDC32_14835, partial [Saprospiraceae bacterium]|nr:hypothetical protein [Saprospiraceae bacterium]
MLQTVLVQADAVGVTAGEVVAAPTFRYEKENTNLCPFGPIGSVLPSEKRSIRHSLLVSSREYPVLKEELNQGTIAHGKTPSYFPEKEQ